MKIIITGSLGHIGKPLSTSLVHQGHAVTVVSSSPERKKDIEALGATAAIGSLEDGAFLADAFTGADAVYTMVPPGDYFNPDLDLTAYYERLGHNYAAAISTTGIKRVVNLSTIGAHLTEGSGILIGAHHVEQILNELPADVAITHIRPTSFYYNLYAYADMIKNAGFIAANYGADDVVPWVSPVDIAAAIAEEIVKPHADNKIRYVASEEVTCSNTAQILGEAVGEPGLEWKIISDEEMLNGLKGAGMNPNIAAGLVEMYSSLHSGLLAEDYYRKKPAVMGKVKLREFAKEFAAAFKH